MNWTLWSVLKYSGFPLPKASFKVSKEKSVSRVLEARKKCNGYKDPSLPQDK